VNRRETGVSPMANFGRMIGGYIQSSNNRYDDRSGSLEQGYRIFLISPSPAVSKGQ